MLEGWRDEQFVIRPPFSAPAELTVKRAAAGLFGCPAYGVFVVGYIADESSGAPSHVWVGRRSPSPSRRGRGCSTAWPRAAWPRARCRSRWRERRRPGRPGSPPRSTRASARPAASATPETRSALKRDVLYTFDLRCPADFAPRCADGKVASYR